MKLIAFLFCGTFIFANSATCQLNDTLAAKVIWIKSLRDCNLIGVVSFCNTADTSVLISGNNIKNKNHKGNGKYEKKITLGQPFIFVIEPEIIVASPTRRMSVKYKNTIVWTSKEPYKLKPRLCLNCIGTNVE